MQRDEQKIAYCRYAPSLGALEGTPADVWGTPPYNYAANKHDPCVFFGLYDLRDYIALWLHKGKKWILWTGTDIRNLRSRFIFNDGKLRRLSVLFRFLHLDFRNWLIKHLILKAENWVENHVEAAALQELGISAQVCPSFMGNIDDFEISFKPGNKVYSSVSGNYFEVYGWDKIPALARQNENIEFHLYGDNSDLKDGICFIPRPGERLGNIFNHGRVPREQMNAEIKEMQGGLRMTPFDGFSEIVAKSILMGQYPISAIDYPHVLKSTELGKVSERSLPNVEGREWYRKHLNNFPWNVRVI